jgi:acetyl esterase/lipase
MAKRTFASRFVASHTLALAATLAVATPSTANRASAQVPAVPRPAPGASMVDLTGVVVARDLDYVADVDYADAKDRLDVFMPEGAAGAPVVVYFHGGLLTGGSKAEGEPLGALLAARGIGVVSANYRLSPGVMHPAHVQDAAAAVAWVMANIERYGGDPSNVYVGGWSAGAYLAALMAVDARWLADAGTQKSRIRGWIPISPFLYVEETAPDRPKTVWGEDPSMWLAASVSPYPRAAVGSVLLIYGDRDDAWRREQNDRFASELRAAGNREVTLVEVPNRPHTALMAMLAAPDDRIVDLVTNFVKGRR